MNVKITKQKNADLRLKIEAWKNRKGERKTVNKRNFDHGKALREYFNKMIDNFNLDKERVLDCLNHYNTFNDDKNKLVRDNKLINNLISEIPGGSQHTVQLDDLDKMLKNE